MSAQEIKVPDIGDFADIPVIEIHVAAGDTVERGEQIGLVGATGTPITCVSNRLAGKICSVVTRLSTPK